MSTKQLNFEQVKAELQGGKSLADISVENSVTYHSLQRLLINNGTSVRQIVPTKHEILKKNIDQWRDEGLTHAEVAALLGTTAAGLYSLLGQNNLKLTRGRRPCRAEDAELQAQTDAALEVLFTKGGSIKSICRELGYEHVHHQVRKVMIDRGVDPTYFYFAFRKYNGWVTIPGHVETKGKRNGNQRIPCRCLSCGKLATVRLNNLLSGKSSGCRQCSRSVRRSVVVLETGEEFPSLLSAYKKLNLSENYHNIYYHILRKETVSVDGYTLQLKQEGK